MSSAPSTTRSWKVSSRFAKMLPMGGSEDPDSVLGPLISEKQRQRVEGIVPDGVARGAEVITGGKRMDRKGYFYEATIITNTTPDMRLSARRSSGRSAR